MAEAKKVNFPHPRDTIPALAVRMALVEERNIRVDHNKAWETSWTRRLTIAVMTYIFAVILLYVIGADYPFLGAMVPMYGYLMANLSLPIIKNMWTEWIYDEHAES